MIRLAIFPAAILLTATDLETSVSGCFAAEDVRHNSVKRVASAIGEGAMAVTFVHRYFKNSEIEQLHELRENLIRAKPRRVIIDSRRDD